MKKVLILVLTAVLFLASSCVTKNLFGDKEYFQALGREGEIVITLNAELLDLNSLIQTEDKAVKFILNRMTRFSIALNDPSGTVGSVVKDLSKFSFGGAIEGSYPKTLVSSALSVSETFTRLRDEATGLTYYADADNSLQIAVPEKNLILFSSSGLSENYSRTYTDRLTLISDEDAARLSASQIGIYVYKPKTMLDFGFDITRSALKNIQSILLFMNDETVSIDFRMESEELANSFSILIKSDYIGNLKREGKKVDIAFLKKMFTQELSTVSVNGMPLSNEQAASIRQTVLTLLDFLK